MVNLKDFRRYKGFTLAEVLITLVIIGVIAAMTIPTLMNNTNNQEYVSRLKKAYSTMAQATNRIIFEEGQVKGADGGWGTSAAVIYNKYKSYISTAKDCPKGTTGCLANNYTRLNGTSGNYDSGSRNNFIMADGTAISITAGDFSADCSAGGEGSNDVCQKILVDVNGSKGPNFIGKDVFMFALKNDRLEPTGCDYDYCENRYGWGCTCRALREGALNYL